MTDRPSIEQQRLADVIRPMFACTEFNCDLCEREALAYARAIVAAVNDGTCDPIVPERKPNLIHDAVLAALRDELADKEAELAELRELKRLHDLAVNLQAEREASDARPFGEGRGSIGSSDSVTVMAYWKWRVKRLREASDD
jgi:hypothetical protein